MFGCGMILYCFKCGCPCPATSLDKNGICFGCHMPPEPPKKKKEEKPEEKEEKPPPTE